MCLRLGGGCLCRVTVISVKSIIPVNSARNARIPEAMENQS
jgi:hypothetical protein